MLGGPVVEAETDPSTTAGSRRKQLLLFVTPTIVDPAGNRLHKDDELPFSTNAVPPHPKPPK